MKISVSHSRICFIAVFILCFAAMNCSSQTPAFAPFEEWKSAITRHNAAQFKALYSSNPAAEITTPAGKVTADDDIAFWSDLKVSQMKATVVQSKNSQPGLQQVVVHLEIQSAATSPARKIYLSELQLWQEQHGQWRLVGAERTAPQNHPPTVAKSIYDENADAHQEIQHALSIAAKAHKRVILVFGANWCYDCRVLDEAFHRPDFLPVLKPNFEVVHVDIGEGDKNQDLMRQYEVPMKKGIPGLAVLDSQGKLVFSQKNGEFANARAMGTDSFLQFLNVWKPPAR